MYVADEQLRPVTVILQDQEQALAAHAPVLERLLLDAIHAVHELTETLRSR